MSYIYEDDFWTDGIDHEDIDSRSWAQDLADAEVVDPDEDYEHSGQQR